MKLNFKLSQTITNVQYPSNWNMSKNHNVFNTHNAMSNVYVLYKNTHTCNLCTPVEQWLGPNVWLILAKIFKQRTIGNKWHYEHHLGCHTHAEHPGAVRMNNWRHDPSFLQEFLILSWWWTFAENFNSYYHFDVFFWWYPNPLTQYIKHNKYSMITLSLGGTQIP